FEVPKEYDFQKAFNQTFGIIKDEKFEVEAEFTGWAAVFVEERIWSNDQVITREGDKVRIKFTASSESEIISWILSFGDEARLISPEMIVKEVSEKIENMKRLYGESSC
ncbi:MAG: helix-turn-helix transcriptional regulator, partial [Desulfomonilaceae bacterium]